MLADLRDALRQLRKAPGFTATVVITLALGIGATTAIFTLVHQVMLKSLPVTKPEELWRIGRQDPLLQLGRVHAGQRRRFFALLLGGVQEFPRTYAGVRRSGRAAGRQCAARRAPRRIAGAGGHAQWAVCLGEFFPHPRRAAVDRPADDRRR